LYKKILTNYSNFERAIEVEEYFKNGVSLKKQIIGGNFSRKTSFSLLTAGIILLTAVFSTSVMAQNEISIDKFMEQAVPLIEQANEYSEVKNDHQMAEKIIKDVLTLFSHLSKEDQKEYKYIGGEIYIGLTVCLSMQKKINEAVDAFEKAVKKYEYANYSRAKDDPDLANIRSDERFIALMESISKDSDDNTEKINYLDILRQAGKYQNADTTGLPRFTYEAVTSENLKNVRQFFKLDTIAGQGDEISIIINLMTWVHSNIRHDGKNYALCEFTAIDIYNYHKSTGKGVNCRHLAITLNELYLAMGFKSRYVTCLPKDEKDSDCHVINSVYSTTLKKWLWMDPSFNAYVKDENGNLLCIEEVRDRLIDGRPLALNEDANYNNEKETTKEWYLDNYMAKNLYWFDRPVNSQFNVESRYRNTNQPFVSLLPLGTERTGSTSKVKTNDAAYFWEH